MSERNDEVVMAVLTAIEQRNLTALPGLYHSQIEFSWPPSLPYSGTFRGAELGEMNAKFASVWAVLQPTERERALNARVIASTGEDVVVNYCWRALDPTGRRFETETLGHYKVRDGKLARAQMFYFDLPGMVAFLKAAAV
jgi:ketosteroid isomerase-like protein